MEIVETGNSEITIRGNVKTIDDYLEIKEFIKGFLERDIQSLVINIPDSISITSALLGLLLRLVYEEKIKITIKVGQESLYTLLEVMNLINVFNVRRLGE